MNFKKLKPSTVAAMRAGQAKLRNRISTIPTALREKMKLGIHSRSPQFAASANAAKKPAAAMRAQARRGAPAKR